MAVFLCTVIMSLRVVDLLLSKLLCAGAGQRRLSNICVIRQFARGLSKVPVQLRCSAPLECSENRR